MTTEPEVKPSELFVSASPHAVDNAMKTSRKIDEAKIKRLLVKALGDLYPLTLHKVYSDLSHKIKHYETSLYGSQRHNCY